MAQVAGLKVQRPMIKAPDTFRISTGAGADQHTIVFAVI